MAFLKLQFKPGINRDQTSYSGEGGWYECDKIRFRSGFPEKLGGWVQRIPEQFFGVCRQLFSWVTTFTDSIVAVGTNNKLYLELGDRLWDITPLRVTFTTPNTDNAISVVSGSTTVTVTLSVAHGATTGDFVTISGAVAVGGIAADTLNVNCQLTVISPTAFTFSAATAATSTVSAAGGTGITLKFEVSAGAPIGVYGFGWGVGTWSRGTWGGPAPTAIFSFQRDWWYDNFDNDLYANIRAGAPYVWERGLTADPTSALQTRAITLQAQATANSNDPNAVPVSVGQLMVSQQNKHLIAFGAVPFGSTSTADYDPLLIRWASQDEPSNWTPAVTNSAGFLRVSRGSRIITAMPTRQEVLVWTDAGLYALQFLGTTDVFGLQEYANDVTIISPRARTSASGIVYWMGRNKFYTYSGRVETLDCTLLNHVFDNTNQEQFEQIVAGSNEQWGEIWWFYPTADSTYNNAYVVYNYLEKLWFYGSLARTAWMDAQFLNGPIAVNTDLANQSIAAGISYDHEVGVDDDTSAMESHISSNDFDIGDGDKFMLARRLVPDIDFSKSTATTPQVTITVRSRNFPGNATRQDTQDARQIVQTAVDEFTEQVFIRARARQMSLKVSSSNLGVHWNLGSPRLDVREDGGR